MTKPRRLGTIRRPTVMGSAVAAPSPCGWCGSLRGKGAIGTVDGRAIAAIGIAEAVRPTLAAAVMELIGPGVEMLRLNGDNTATAQRIGTQLGVATVIADIRPGDKAAKVTELMNSGRRVAMVGDDVNDARALLGMAIGAGTDVAVETVDVVLMRSDPLDVAVAPRIGRRTRFVR